MIEITIHGQRYTVPEELTILRAFEWAGYRLTRGVGCRGGFCGACGTVYRLTGDHRLYYALACQTTVKPGMILGQIPFFPAQRPLYHLDQLAATSNILVDLYPELLRCFGCNTCTKSCPQELDVLQYISTALQGDIAKTAELSFDCIMCGLCVARCPAEITPPNVALLARRLYGRYLAPPASHLQQRLQEMNAGLYQEAIDQLKTMSVADLKQQYANRDIED